MRLPYARSLLVALLGCVALNLHDAWRLRQLVQLHQREQLELRQRTAAQRPHVEEPPPSPPPPPPAIVGARTATWFVPTERERRVARVSSVRAHDASLFHQAGLEVEVPEGVASSSGGSLGGGSRRARKGDASDLLLLSWRLPEANRPLYGRNGSRRAIGDRGGGGPDGGADGGADGGEMGPPTLGSADVLWGQWTSSLQFFDRRLRAGQLVNGLMGLEHDTLGTPLSLARSHQRCVQTWGVRACNYTSAQLVLHSQRDVSRLVNLFGDNELADLAEWREIASDGLRSVWLAKQAAAHRSLVHQGASMFEGRQIVSSRDPLPAGLWVLQPWPTSPMLWRHHRFFLRTWLVIPSVAPLRVYMLQDGWAYVVAKPYRSDQLLDSYTDVCVHLWSTERCQVTHAHRIVRSNHEAFLEGLVGVRRDEVRWRWGSNAVGEGGGRWRWATAAGDGGGRRRWAPDSIRLEVYLPCPLPTPHLV